MFLIYTIQLTTKISKLSDCFISKETNLPNICWIHAKSLLKLENPKNNGFNFIQCGISLSLMGLAKNIIFKKTQHLFEHQLCVMSLTFWFHQNSSSMHFNLGQHTKKLSSNFIFTSLSLFVSNNAFFNLVILSCRFLLNVMIWPKNRHSHNDILVSKAV